MALIDNVPGAVAPTNDITKAYYIDLASVVNAVLGNGSGQSGYGQVCASYEAYNDSTITTNTNIAAIHWNTLRTDINKCHQHQFSTNLLSSTMTANYVIGADASSAGVTRNTDGTFDLATPIQTGKGVNDWRDAVVSIVNNVNLAHTDEFTDPVISPVTAYANSIRNYAWGTGTEQVIRCVFRVKFDGGYTTTDDSGNSVTASGADHRRHFFNAGGYIKIFGQVSGSNAIDSDWNVSVGGKTIYFGKNSTTASGGGLPANGVNNIPNQGTAAVGNYQINNSWTYIYYKGAGETDTDYADNYWTVEARQVASDTIEFRVSLDDAKGPTPNIDEQVGSTVGAFTRFDLQQGTASGTYVSVPAGYVTVTDEFNPGA